MIFLLVLASYYDTCNCFKWTGVGLPGVVGYHVQSRVEVEQKRDPDRVQVRPLPTVGLPARSLRMRKHHVTQIDAQVSVQVVSECDANKR